MLSTMELSFNYSRRLAEMVRQGRVPIDRFKCPAWDDMVAEAQALLPVNVHFALVVGRGDGRVRDGESKGTANWERVEALLRRTGTPFVNLHLEFAPRDYPDVPLDGTDEAWRARLVESAARDIGEATRRFGAERVLIENDHGDKGAGLRLGIEPATIAAIVRETGCGFLLDLSHARLAARALGMDTREYIGQLPMKRAGELHVTGMRVFDAALALRAREAGVPEKRVRRMEGAWMDHLPMTEEDFAFLDWALARVRAGAWGTPWVLSYEVGGVGGLWEIVAAMTPFDAEAVRMRAMLDVAREGDGSARAV